MSERADGDDEGWDGKNLHRQPDRHNSCQALAARRGLPNASCVTSDISSSSYYSCRVKRCANASAWQLHIWIHPISPPKSLPQTPFRPSSAIRAVSFCKPRWWCCQASFCEVAPAIKQQWREWLIQQWRWQYSSASIWRQPAGLEPFQTALCFSSEEKSIHNWWQFKGRLYCGISNKTSENTENKRGR